MYHAKIHPEQYSNTLTDAQMKQLHASIHYVCSTAVEVLGDSDKFPEDWLFKHRWSKGKKDQANKLPNGKKIVFLTVGGRTSAVVPSIQKKTGPVIGDVKPESDSDDEINPRRVRGKPAVIKKEKPAKGMRDEDAPSSKDKKRGDRGLVGSDEEYDKPAVDTSKKRKVSVRAT